MAVNSEKHHTHPPAAMWAQRKDKIYLTLNLEDCKDPKIQLTETQLTFRSKGGPDKEVYEFTVEFYKEVDPNQSKYTVLPRNVPFVLIKKEDGPYWPRLFKDTVKVHWLKTDFNKWKDEDDSDVDEKDDMNLEDMMNSMGGLGGDPGLDEKEEDSDDEDLPDLE
ncbi:hypothetical protein ScPMuIL_015989 [Solemya velum]